MLYKTIEQYDEAIADYENMLTDIIKSGVEEDITASDTARKVRRPGLTTVENSLRRLRRERSILAHGGCHGSVEVLPNW